MVLPAHIRFKETIHTPELVAHAVSVLTTAESERRATFRSVARQDSFALGRLAARSLLAEPLECPPPEVPLEVLPDGSIRVPGTPWQLSISHSGPYAAAAIATSEIGLDLERIRRRPESLFRFILHPEEMTLLDRVDLPTEHQIVLFWALKESVLKAKRTGLRLSPKTLRLTVDLDAGTARIVGQSSWESRFELRDDHILAVSWPTAESAEY
ncbi:MAG: 4'-phosphopantetheinyl transferase [Rhodothermales bacterium]|jgi:4'-phosphopantetheinyl transferase